jgi:hypothetical protein
MALPKFQHPHSTEVASFQGAYSIMTAPPGVRPSAWAAREEMLASGIIDHGVLHRWEAPSQAVIERCANAALVDNYKELSGLSPALNQVWNRRGSATGARISQARLGRESSQVGAAATASLVSDAVEVGAHRRDADE